MSDSKKPSYDDTTPAYDDTASESDKNVLAKFVDKGGPSELESVLAGAGQGLTLSHAPQLGAAMGAGMEKMSAMQGLGPDTGQSLKDLYNEYLMAAKKRDASAAEANPKSYLAGNIGGGLALGGAAGMAAKPLLAATQAMNPTLAATGQVMNKIAPGALPLTGAGMISAQGQSNAPLGSPEMLGEMAEGATGALATGAAIPPALGLVAKGAQKTAKSAKNVAGLAAESLFGQAPGAFNRGLEGELLIGKEAAKKTGDEMLDFAKQVPGQLEAELNKLGKQKNDIIQQAQEKGVRIDPQTIDDFMSKHLGTESKSNLPEVQRELEQFKELLNTAKSGPEVKQVVRKYFGEGNTERGDFANLFAQKQAEEDALALSEPSTPTTQKEQFEQLFAQKQAESQALAKNAQDLQLSYEPIPGQTDKVLGIIKQANYDADGNILGYSKVASKLIQPDAPPIDQPKLEMLLQPTDVPGKSLGIIRKAIVDENGQITGYQKVSSKLLSDEEAATFKDMSETVRTGDKNLTEPEQLLQLYKDLKQKSQFGDNSFKTDSAQNAASQAIEDVQGMLRNKMKELQPTDQRIHALKQAQEILGATDKDPRNVMKTFAAMLGRTEGTNVTGAAARSDLTNLINQIKIANPELGHQIQAQAENLANKFKVTGAVQQEIYLSHPATLKAYAAKGANVLGYGISQTPQWMQDTAGALAKKGSQLGSSLSSVLSKAATKDESSRNAIMFGLMQNPAYRQTLQEYMPQASDSQTTTQEKHK